MNQRHQNDHNQGYKSHTADSDRLAPAQGQSVTREQADRMNVSEVALEAAMTAYAIDETAHLSEAQVASIEQQLDHQGALTEVASVRETAALLTDALAADMEHAGQGLSPMHRLAIEDHLNALDEMDGLDGREGLDEMSRGSQQADLPPRPLSLAQHLFEKRRKLAFGLATTAAAIFLFGGLAGILFATWQNAWDDLDPGTRRASLDGSAGPTDIKIVRRSLRPGSTSPHNVSRPDGPLLDNPYVAVRDSPLSAFPAKVSTEAYWRLLEFLKTDRMPPRSLVRIEEYVNAFDYAYAPPTDGDDAFASHAEVRPCPWNPQNRLARIGLKGAVLNNAQPQAGDKPKPIAQDVEIQVEFNPTKVAAYRLIGYENRPARANVQPPLRPVNEINPGHEVTALYEVIPAEQGHTLAGLTPIDQLRYQQPRLTTDAAKTDELFTVRLRYHATADGPSTATRTQQFPVADAHKFADGYEAASSDFKFAAAVAAFGMILRDSPYKGNATFETVISLADESLREQRDADSNPSTDQSNPDRVDAQPQSNASPKTDVDLKSLTEEEIAKLPMREQFKLLVEKANRLEQEIEEARRRPRQDPLDNVIDAIEADHNKHQADHEDAKRPAAR